MEPNASMNASFDSVAVTDIVAGTTGSLGWLWRTVAATCCWAISDVICDACIGASTNVADKKKQGSLIEAKPEETTVAFAPATPTGRLRRRRQSKNSPEAKDSRPSSGNKGDCAEKTQSGGQDPESPTCSPSAGKVEQQLTPEQNALVSGCISLLVAGVATTQAATSAGNVFSTDAVTGLAGLGGCFHFSAYLMTLCAFSSASSTVITPLMQLSAVWMLPFSVLTAVMGFATLIRPVHLFSIVLIGAGGFLPAAAGSFSFMASRDFWRQRSVKFVALGELLISIYNLILHQATFSGIGGLVNSQASDEGPGSTLRFFLISRAANGLMCVLLFFSVPALRRQALGMHKVSPRFLAVALVGECLSMCGVCLVTFSYSSFYEPSVVNAVEGGLQQLFNLFFAVLTHRALGWGRGVDQVLVKCISFALVAVGLTLSTA